jgi:DNA polymerase-3 subunit alpha
MGDVEKAGLLKMDFLGLRNLTILDLAVRLIERTRGETIDLFALPLDDQETYALLQRGETKGVFQLESPGIRDLLIKMKPDVFADIIATNALYRPGPLNGGMVDAYVNRKHKRETFDYEHPTMREVLEETYGVMVYQEQVMRILNRLGGIELSQAYACIKAISKKKTEFIAQAKAQFLAGAAERKVPKETATKVFDLIVFFGGYGFNKSHSTAYALLAFQTAYLKAHYPTEFMAALLSSEIDGAGARQAGRAHRRMPADEDRGPAARHQPGFGRVPGRRGGQDRLRPLGDQGGRPEGGRGDRGRPRGGGPFASLDDLFERVPLATVTQACVEALIKAGAFDGFGARRSQLLAALPRAAQSGQASQNDRKRGQGSLFDAFESNGSAEPAAARQSLPDIPELPDAERLAEEKKVLGFYMSSHPLTRHAALLQALATHRVEELGAVAEKSEVILGGMISGVQVKNVQKSRSGLTRMAKLCFEDLTGSVPSMLWPEEFAKSEDLVKNDLIGFVKGTLDRRRDPAELIISKIIPLDRGPPSSRGASSSGSTRGSTRRPTSSACCGWSGSTGQPRPLPGDPRPDAGPSRHLQGRRLAEGPPRRRPPRRPRGGRRRRQRPPPRPPRGDRPRRDDRPGRGRRQPRTEPDERPIPAP